MEKNAAIQKSRADEYSERFDTSIKFIWETLGRRAFRPERSLNTAVFDGVMVGVADRMRKGPIVNKDAFISAYNKLLADDKFIDAYTRSTADEEKVRVRISLAKGAFANVS